MTEEPVNAVEPEPAVTESVTEPAAPPVEEPTVQIVEEPAPAPSNITVEDAFTAPPVPEPVPEAPVEPVTPPVSAEPVLSAKTLAEMEMGRRMVKERENRDLLAQKGQTSDEDITAASKVNSEL